MRFYVASRFRNYEAVRVVEQELIGRNHTITHSWATNSMEFDAAGKLFIENPEKDLDLAVQQVLAYEDMFGVQDADALVLLWTPDMSGAYIELGLAISIPIPIYIIGSKRWTIFWSFPDIHFFDTLEKFYRYLDA